MGAPSLVTERYSAQRAVGGGRAAAAPPGQLEVLVKAVCGLGIAVCLGRESQ